MSMIVVLSERKNIYKFKLFALVG